MTAPNANLFAALRAAFPQDLDAVATAGATWTVHRHDGQPAGSLKLPPERALRCRWKRASRR
jgi:hypothetical protein